jgi:peptidoglycan hydrolase CwlO-like protein
MLVSLIMLLRSLTTPVLLQVAQLQKQKKKASKKASTATDTPKDAEAPKESEATTEPAATMGITPPVEDTPADEKPQEETLPDAATPEQPAEPESQEKPSEPSEPVESPVEPMPPAPNSPDPEAEPQTARLDTPRAGHGRQPSLSIQSKMRSSSFRKTSISQGSAPSPAALKSPPQSLPPLTGDGESVHEVFRKQSTKIEELEKDNKRLEKELSDATVRWRKTEDQLEDLREASVDGAELREQLKQAEEKVASIEALVWIH